MSRQQPPNSGIWSRIGDPAGRLRAGPAHLYRFYLADAGMLAHVYQAFAVLPGEHQLRLQDQADRYRDLFVRRSAVIPARGA